MRKLGTRVGCGSMDNIRIYADCMKKNEDTCDDSEDEGEEEDSDYEEDSDEEEDSDDEDDD